MASKLIMIGAVRISSSVFSRDQLLLEYGRLDDLRHLGGFATVNDAEVASYTKEDLRETFRLYWVDTYPGELVPPELAPRVPKTAGWWWGRLLSVLAKAKRLSVWGVYLLLALLFGGVVVAGAEFVKKASSAEATTTAPSPSPTAAGVPTPAPSATAVTATSPTDLTNQDLLLILSGQISENRAVVAADTEDVSASVNRRIGGVVDAIGELAGRVEALEGGASASNGADLSAVLATATSSTTTSSRELVELAMRAVTFNDLRHRYGEHEIRELKKENILLVRSRIEVPVVEEGVARVSPPPTVTPPTPAPFGRHYIDAGRGIEGNVKLLGRVWTLRYPTPGGSACPKFCPHPPEDLQVKDKKVVKCRNCNRFLTPPQGS